MEKIKEHNELLVWTKALGFAVILAWGIRLTLFTQVVVVGASMMPTFEDGDNIIVNKIETKLTEHDRFDVIVFETVDKTNYIKRIIGLPGDSIAYKNDALIINGEKYDEFYLDEYKKALIDNGLLTGNFTLDEYLGEVVVPEGHLFVLGDNRRNSKDSRDPSVGFVSMNDVSGTAKLVFAPFNNVKIIK